MSENNQSNNNNSVRSLRGSSGIYEVVMTAVSLLATLAAVISLYPVFFADTPPPRPELADRVSQIRASLEQIDTIILEVEELGQQAIEAEALSQLTEEQVSALESRLNNTQREVMLLVIGAVLGVFVDRVVGGIGSLINKSRNTRSAES